MKKEIKLNTITWILLVILICISTIFAESDLKYSFLIIPALAVIKFITVIFQFVEVKKAHLVWKLVGVLFAIIYFVGVIALY